MTTSCTIVPGDFCFYAEKDETDGNLYVHFCSLKAFRNEIVANNENLWSSLEELDVLDNLVPEDLDEVFDGCFVTTRDADDVEDELVSLGFKKDEEFWNFMRSVPGAEASPSDGAR